MWPWSSKMDVQRFLASIKEEHCEEQELLLYMDDEEDKLIDAALSKGILQVYQEPRLNALDKEKQKADEDNISCITPLTKWLTRAWNTCKKLFKRRRS